MKLGHIVLWVCGLIVVSALTFGGYVWYVEHRVENFKTLLASQTPDQLNRTLGLISSAPPMRCVEQSSTFLSALTVVMHFHAGKMRLDFIDPSHRNETIYEVMDGNDFYVWTESSDSILKLSLADSPQLPGAEDTASALHRLTSCEVWWSPDDSVFQLPAKLIVEG